MSPSPSPSPTPSSATPLVNYLDSPVSPGQLYRSANENNSYPSIPTLPTLPNYPTLPPSPRYDSPFSPILTHSPFLDPSHPSSIQLPPSPYDSSFSPVPSSPRLMANQTLNTTPELRNSYFSTGLGEAENTPLYSDASSTHRLKDFSSPSSSFEPPYRPHSLNYFNPSIDLTRNNNRDTITSLANDTTLCGDNDVDEKGFYGALDRGMGMDETKERVSEKGYSAKRWKAAADNRNGKWSRKRWFITSGLIGLAVIVAAIAAVVATTKSKSSSGGNSSLVNDQGDPGSTSSSSTSTNNNEGKNQPSWGADGSTITTE